MSRKRTGGSTLHKAKHITQHKYQGHPNMKPHAFRHTNTTKYCCPRNSPIQKEKKDKWWGVGGYLTTPSFSLSDWKPYSRIYSWEMPTPDSRLRLFRCSIQCFRFPLCFWYYKTLRKLCYPSGALVSSTSHSVFQLQSMNFVYDTENNHVYNDVKHQSNRQIDQ